MRLIAIAALTTTMCAAAHAEDAKFVIGECYASMWSDARSKPVADRIGIGQSPTPLALRASRLKANAKEKESLSFVAEEMEKCQKLDKANRATYHPLISGMIEEYEATHRSNLAKAYAGDLTWGGLIDANDANNASFDKRKAEIFAQAEAERKAAAERQAATDARAEELRKAAAMAAYEQRQQIDAQQRLLEQQRRAQESQDFTNSLLLLNAARPRPAPLMPPVSCSSRNVAGTVYTDCR